MVVVGCWFEYGVLVVECYYYMWCGFVGVLLCLCFECVECVYVVVVCIVGVS